MLFLNSFSGYNQICIKRKDHFKITLTSIWGTFAYECMPFGLINTSATFQRAVHINFDDLIGFIIQDCLDDLTVHSKLHEDDSLTN
jgi:hypothetical protein